MFLEVVELLELRGYVVTTAAAFYLDRKNKQLIVPDMLAALTDDQQATYADAVPLGRLGQVHEIAAAVTFLASEDAGYVTGAVLPVDGGLFMG